MVTFINAIILSKEDVSNPQGITEWRRSSSQLHDPNEYGAC